MGNAIRVSGPINAAGLELTMETGRLAQLADGAVLLTVGDTVVLSTVATSTPREGIDFFPLTVDVEERMYAAGKIPGSFFRREGRPGEAAILTCRLTDRPLRPSFPEGFRDETQVIATILGSDQVNPHDVLSINGASAAIMVSGTARVSGSPTRPTRRATSRPSSSWSRAVGTSPATSPS
jgi:polyribonucleotide nucleotidyltransferase